MLRDWDLSEISDGKIYRIDDMVKADCNDCKGCSKCCHDMGQSIVLDPLDAFRLSKRLECDFAALIGKGVELNVVDGIILPNLSMNMNEGACVFLNEEGRCSIHSDRPSICRMFPLGRLFDNGEHTYFFQVHECPMTNKTKAKVKKLLDTPDIGKYEAYVDLWHYFLKEIQAIVVQCNQDVASKICKLILNKFYFEKYDEFEDFYEQLNDRVEFIRQSMR